MNENHQDDDPGRTGCSPAAEPGLRGAPASCGRGSVGSPAAGAPRAPGPRRPDGYNCSRSRARRDPGSRGRPLGNGRPPHAAGTPPTLATQLNNGDIAGPAAAPRPPRRLTPAAGSWSGGQPGAGSGRGGARAWLPGGGGGGLLPERHCLEGSRPQDGQTQKGKWEGTARGGRGRSGGPALAPPPARGARGGKLGGAGSRCARRAAGRSGPEAGDAAPRARTPSPCAFRKAQSWREH